MPHRCSPRKSSPLSARYITQLSVKNQRIRTPTLGEPVIAAFALLGRASTGPMEKAGQLSKLRRRQSIKSPSSCRSAQLVEHGFLERPQSDQSFCAICRKSRRDQADHRLICRQRIEPSVSDASPSGLLDAPNNPHARDAAVGKRVEPDGSDCDVASQWEDMIGVWLQPGSAKHRFPGV